MTTTFAAALNERYRSAMLALYLHEAVPNDPHLIEQGLATQIKTPNDLYEYWLLDVLVSQNVPTSPVACAIASLQQLVNGMMLNMEPGYSDDSLTPQQIKTWQNGLNRYPVWAAIQQLHYFPDIYLDPTLRLNKTDSFKQLESDLNQAQIQPETVQAAVLAYLARFEEVANLKICNGYIDGEDFANSTYYFIAKSPAENAWYWRSLDMSQRPVKTPTRKIAGIPYKYDKPLPNAWTDWQKANVPISEKALEHTVRPCWFNNRLFVIWAEVELQDADATADEMPADPSVKVNPRFRLYASYKKYDDSWSTPRVHIERYCQTPELVKKTLEEIEKDTQTIAVYDHSTTPESMLLALYSGYMAGENDPTGGGDQYDFLRTVRIDKNFHIAALYPPLGFVTPSPSPGAKALAPLDQENTRPHVLQIGHIFASDTKNARRLQFWLPNSEFQFGDVEHKTPVDEPEVWNFSEWQNRIKRSNKDDGLIYDKSTSSVKLTVKLETEFTEDRTLDISIYDRNNPGLELFKLKLVTNDTIFHDKRYTLLKGSTITPGTDWLDLQNARHSFTDNIGGKNLIIDGSGGDTFSLPATKKGETASLEGKRLFKAMLELMMDGNSGYFISECRTYAGGTRKLLLHRTLNVKQEGPYRYTMFVAHPLDVVSDTPPTTFADMRTLSESSLVNRLARDAELTYTFSIDQVTYRPDGWPVDWPKETMALTIPLIYGVLIYESHFLGWSLKGGALKTLSLGWNELSEEVQIAPSIGSVADPTQGDSPSLGRAQFLDFTKSRIEQSDGATSDESLRAPIRMNTVFARQLINRAEDGMETLMSWETQQMKEPPLSRWLGAQRMDFSGAYSTQFCELFLHTPWLVAHRLNEEQQYDEARRWLSFLFDPSRQSGDAGHPGYWQSVPLEESVWPTPPDPSQAVLYPDDPFQIALSFLVHFRKALYRLYIDIELNQADQAFRELTHDGLAEAKLRYVRVLDLLGQRPDVQQVDHWRPVRLDELSTAKNEQLREFELQLNSAHQQWRAQPPLRIGKAPAAEAAPLLCLRPYNEDSSLAGVDNPYLRRPFNRELIQSWERAESRLYNLRHNLDMAGNPLNLRLFATPLDPRALLAAWGQGLSGAALSRLLNPQIPHYRFTFMFALAQNAVDSVIQFGATLLSLIERKESAQYLELQQQQAWNLAKIAVEIQTQAISIDEKNKEALLASQAVIVQRLSYYEKLITKGLSADELIPGESLNQAGDFEAMAHTASGVGALARGIPNISGFSFGGMDWSGPFSALAEGLSVGAALSRKEMNIAELKSRYDRRAQEWTQVRDQAKLENEQVKAQLAVYEEQHKATQLQLRQARTALEQAQVTHDFLLGSNRFSRSQTYDWLNSKFSGFYSSAYTTAQSLCQAAEACWQYEMGDFSRTFIRPGAWNATYRGLGAGEELKMSLQQMHADYLKNNRRDLEIRKTVSLKSLKSLDPTVNKTWDEIKKDLIENGTCAFELTQKMFDDDYKDQNHYLRRIKTISVTLPVSIPPYIDIRAVLAQSYSKVEMATAPGNARENLRASQQIALSHGIDDNGMFQLNFQDERYLPFEYTGAVSRWSLTFPNLEAQAALLKSLTDIIVHVNYTARREGGAL
ncbi:Tc toxin subunit A-related protein [Pseudomonas hamedanensis]|uniref:Efflux RND transporter periplasmic adaptor subunit n=1 Tax=Pseudomonas hamedanensis TaxID=2745504 RepID=A0A9E6P096_9PSED|nr:neuraminidase-like domain-containing protein [Pseudomonas hamedanensis]QXI17672.1 efflux RND transporter periplasmic adaptor subunit [Pseudomonas hamedanensis]